MRYEDITLPLAAPPMNARPAAAAPEPYMDLPEFKWSQITRDIFTPEALIKFCF